MSGEVAEEAGAGAGAGARADRPRRFMSGEVAAGAGAGAAAGARADRPRRFPTPRRRHCLHHLKCLRLHRLLHRVRRLLHLLHRVRRLLHLLHRLRRLLHLLRRLRRLLHLLHRLRLPRGPTTKFLRPHPLDQITKRTVWMLAQQQLRNRHASWQKSGRRQSTNARIVRSPSCSSKPRSRKRGFRRYNKRRSEGNRRLTHWLQP